MYLPASWEERGGRGRDDATMALPPLMIKEKWGATGRIVVVVRGGEKVPNGGAGQLQGYRRERGGPSRTFPASIYEGRMDDGGLAVVLETSRAENDDPRAEASDPEGERDARFRGRWQGSRTRCAQLTGAAKAVVVISARPRRPPSRHVVRGGG